MNYITKSQFVASYLLALSRIGQVRMVSCQRNDQNEMVLEFAPKDLCEQLVNDYYEGRAEPMNPRIILDSVNDFKRLLKSTGGIQ